MPLSCPANITCTQLVPYSEHSNFLELVEFVRFLRPQEVLPTVFSDASDRQNIVRRFAHCVDRTAAARAFIGTMTRGNSCGDGVGGAIGGATSVSGVSSGGRGNTSRNGSHFTGAAKYASLSNEPDSPGPGSPAPAALEASAAAGALAGSSTMETIEIDDAVANAAADAATATTQPAPWVCLACTFKHRSPREAAFLQCGVCCTPRAAPANSVGGTTAAGAAAEESGCRGAGVNNVGSPAAAKSAAGARAGKKADQVTPSPAGAKRKAGSGGKGGGSGSGDGSGRSRCGGGSEKHGGNKQGKTIGHFFAKQRADGRSEHITK
ncbi:unnamed protein product [Phaeothamnion confervicola]